MCRRSQASLLRLVEERRHDVRTLGADLQAIDAVGSCPADVLARDFWRGHAAFVPTTPRALVVVDARRDDLVPLAALLVADRYAVVAKRHATNGRHAVRQPQLVGVLRLRILRGAAGVHVHVDEARHEVHAGGIDFEVGILRRAIGSHRQAGCPSAPHRRNAIAGDDDVDRTLWRCTRAVDERDPADDERLVRSASLVGAAIRCRRQSPLALRLARRLCGLRGSRRLAT